MKIIVKAHTLELEKEIDVNSGEYNVQNVEFTFSSEYESLTKMAIFTNGTNSFQTIITDNECIIPYEVIEEGTVCVGVYGYETNGDNLVKRYSPKPVFFNVEPGSYHLAESSIDPSSDIIAQILQELENQSEDITQLQNNYNNLIENTIPSIESSIPTKTSQLQNDSGFITEGNIPTKTSQLQNDSGFITKEVDNLTNYTPTSSLSAVATSGAYSDLTGTPDLSVYATTTQLGTETTNRENADIGLQGQIDAITSATDVKDIVGTYTDLQNYDTQHLGNNDIIKVLQDSTHNDAMTYYRWIKDTSTWQYIGQEGPYYTKSEIDTTLQPYVKNTDYATNSTGGVIKIDQNYGLRVSSGTLVGYGVNYTDYGNALNQLVIDKGTLENVITGKNLETANNKVTSISSSSTDTQYPSAKCVYDLVGDIETILTTLDIGSGV